MKRIMCKAVLAIAVVMPLIGSMAAAQEVEIPVIFDRSYLEEIPLPEELMQLDFRKKEIAVSPDGQWLAFIGDQNVFDIWIVPIDGGEPVKVYEVPDEQLLIIDEFENIANEYGNLSSISFSPDGTEITFSRRYYDPDKGSSWEVDIDQEEGSESIHFTGIPIPTIESVNIATGEVRTLVEEGSNPSWSADGHYLAYDNFDHRYVTDPEHADHNGVPALLDMETGETRFMTEEDGCSGLVLSADNSMLVCTDRDGFYKISLETGEKTSYPVELMGGFTLMRVPGSNYIMYDEFVDGLRMISLFDPETGETVWAIVGLGSQAYSGCFTPDGNSIMYLKEYDFSYDRVESEGSVGVGNATMICRRQFDAEMRFAIGNTEAPPEVPVDYGLLPEYGTLISDIESPNHVMLDDSPVWSPNGEQIAFSVHGEGLDDQIKIASAMGGESETVYTVPFFEYKGVSVRPAFLDISGYTPDGSEILFSLAALDEARNSTPHVVIKDAGTTIGWSDPLKYLYAVNLETGDVRTVVEGASFGLYSPDGAYLAYMIKNREDTGDQFLEEHNNQIVVRNLATGAETFLNIWPSNFYDFEWTNDSSAVMAYTSLSKSTYPTEFSLLPIDGSEPRKLNATGNPPRVLSISPVDNQLAIYNMNKILYIRDLETGDTERFSPEVPGIFSNATFSPDGTKVACIIEFTGADIGSKYDTHKREHVFVLDITVPSDISPTVVADVVPAAELVIGNYPNPFNPATTISFSLPADGITRLDVFNLSGQKVRELVNDHMIAGMHEIVWNGRNDSGMPLASGLYIARIAAGSHMATQRMMLMK